MPLQGANRRWVRRLGDGNTILNAIMAGEMVFLALLRHFPNECGLLKFIKGGFFLRKNPLECVVSVYSNSENAIEQFHNTK